MFKTVISVCFAPPFPDMVETQIEENTEIFGIASSVTLSVESLQSTGKLSVHEIFASCGK